MGVKITVKENGLNALLAKLKRGGKATITVGVLAKEGAQPAKGDSALTVIDVAVRNEFGYQAVDANGEKWNIPARPFIRGWFDAHEGEAHVVISRLLQRMVAEKDFTAAMAFNQIGLFAQGGIQTFIANRGEGTYAENSAVTIKKKGSDTPLINTGQLRQSITYSVQSKGVVKAGPKSALAVSAGKGKKKIAKALKKAGVRTRKTLLKAAKNAKKSGVKKLGKVQKAATKQVNRTRKSIVKYQKALAKDFMKQIRPKAPRGRRKK